jgi:hypothetical protein
METLGHSQISLTMNTYSHVLPRLQADAAAKLDAILSVRCLVPRCGGGTIDVTTKETLWDRYFTEAPRRLTPSGVASRGVGPKRELICA